MFLRIHAKMEQGKQRGLIQWVCWYAGVLSLLALIIIGFTFTPTNLAHAQTDPEHGLVGRYYASPTPLTTFTVGEKPRFIRVDPQINFTWNGNQWPVYTPTLSVLWTGFLTISTPGTYRFTLTADDGATLLIDDTQALVVEQRQNATAISTSSTALPLSAGSYPIEIHYFVGDSQGQGVIKLEWTPPGGAKEIIPTASLTPRLPDKAVLPGISGGSVLSPQVGSTVAVPTAIATPVAATPAAAPSASSTQSEVPPLTSPLRQPGSTTLTRIALVILLGIPALLAVALLVLSLVYRWKIHSVGGSAALDQQLKHQPHREPSTAARVATTGTWQSEGRISLHLVSRNGTTNEPMAPPAPTTPSVKARGEVPVGANH